jgi:hypothetical protein
MTHRHQRRPQRRAQRGGPSAAHRSVRRPAGHTLGYGRAGQRNRSIGIDHDETSGRRTIAGHAGQTPPTPHLLVSARTAYRPVTDYFLSNLFRGHNATLDRLRADRWLDEALDRGPDPLHLAAVFGISTATAIRYANAARSILEPDPEHQPP